MATTNCNDGYTCIDESLCGPLGNIKTPVTASSTQYQYTNPNGKNCRLTFNLKPSTGTTTHINVLNAAADVAGLTYFGFHQTNPGLAFTYWNGNTTIHVLQANLLRPGKTTEDPYTVQTPGLLFQSLALLGGQNVDAIVVHSRVGFVDMIGRVANLYMIGSFVSKNAAWGSLFNPKMDSLTLSGFEFHQQQANNVFHALGNGPAFCGLPLQPGKTRTLSVSFLIFTDPAIPLLSGCTALQSKVLVNILEGENVGLTKIAAGTKAGIARVSLKGETNLVCCLQEQLDPTSYGNSAEIQAQCKDFDTTQCGVGFESVAMLDVTQSVGVSSGAVVGAVLAGVALVPGVLLAGVLGRRKF